VAQPSVAQPSVAQPSVAQPSVAQPSVAQPSVAQPSVAQPSVAQPSAVPSSEPPAPEVLEVAAGRQWQVPAGGFWQVHPAAADTLVNAVLELLRPAEGEVAWDLYGGAGLFAAAVAERTRARLTVVESSPVGVAAARANLADLAGIEVVAAKVEVALARRRVTGPVDLVVLDPPRTGAGAKVVQAIVAAGPRAVAYVACDPAAFARDVATFAEAGWRLAELRGYDCFPMTQHIECVGLLLPPPTT
jgi:tRNA/tmRNA/rRNA uracil-C5-methylase (TrmA/RlmC/RlmD family)